MPWFSQMGWLSLGASPGSRGTLSPGLQLVGTLAGPTGVVRDTKVTVDHAPAFVKHVAGSMCLKLFCLPGTCWEATAFEERFPKGEREQT